MRFAEQLRQILDEGWEELGIKGFEEPEGLHWTKKLDKPKVEPEPFRMKAEVRPKEPASSNPFVIFYFTDQETADKVHADGMAYVTIVYSPSEKIQRIFIDTTDRTYKTLHIMEILAKHGIENFVVRGPRSGVK